MLAKGAKAQGRCGLAVQSRRRAKGDREAGASRARSAARPQRRKLRRNNAWARCRISSSRSSARLVEQPPSGRAGATRSSSTAIACSCGSKTARPRCRPARASTGRRNSPPSPRRPRSCRTCIIDGEIVALDHNGAPDFAALQAALSDGKTDDLIFFAFDLLFADGEDLRPLPLVRAQGAAARRFWRTQDGNPA